MFQRLWGTTAWKNFFWPMNVGFRQGVSTNCAQTRPKKRRGSIGSSQARPEPNPCFFPHTSNPPAAARGHHRRGHRHGPGPGMETERGRVSLRRTAFRPVTLFDVSRQRVKVAAEADLPAALPPSRLSARQAGRLDRATPCCCSPRSKRGSRPAGNLPTIFRLSSAPPPAGCRSGKTISVKPCNCRSGIAGSRRGRCTISRRRRAASWRTPSVLAAQLPSSPTPAPPGPMPSVMPGNVASWQRRTGARRRL